MVFMVFMVSRERGERRESGVVVAKSQCASIWSSHGGTTSKWRSGFPTNLVGRLEHERRKKCLTGLWLRGLTCRADATGGGRCVFLLVLLFKLISVELS